MIKLIIFLSVTNFIFIFVLIKILALNRKLKKQLEKRVMSDNLFDIWCDQVQNSSLKKNDKFKKDREYRYNLFIIFGGVLNNVKDRIKKFKILSEEFWLKSKGERILKTIENYIDEQIDYIKCEEMDSPLYKEIKRKINVSTIFTGLIQKEIYYNQKKELLIKTNIRRDLEIYYNFDVLKSALMNVIRNAQNSKNSEVGIIPYDDYSLLIYMSDFKGFITIGNMLKKKSGEKKLFIKIDYDSKRFEIIIPNCLIYRTGNKEYSFTKSIEIIWNSKDSYNDPSKRTIVLIEENLDSIGKTVEKLSNIYNVHNIDDVTDLEMKVDKIENPDLILISSEFYDKKECKELLSNIMKYEKLKNIPTLSLIFPDSIIEYEKKQTGYFENHNHLKDLLASNEFFDSIEEFLNHGNWNISQNILKN